ncbi:MAG: cytochrome B6 [Dehalococcoidia bacterium]|nr:MAG: cytochrome B6 [Dehalococcoidia bacterium]
MSGGPHSRAANESGSGWTGALRRGIARRLPLDELLPTQQPSYVRSWTYVFGAITIAALIWLVISGSVLAMKGPQWWHHSATGKFFNSLHFWGVQIFFVFMVLHLWAMFWGAAWRDGRTLTWVVGTLLFFISIPTAFTGYLSQENFDAQWIAVNAKDALNSTGIGGLFNPLDFGQAYGIHVVLLPATLVALVALHIVLVRMKGVVRPIGAPPPVGGAASADERERQR